MGLSRSSESQVTAGLELGTLHLLAGFERLFHRGAVYRLLDDYEAVLSALKKRRLVLHPHALAACVEHGGCRRLDLVETDRLHRCVQTKLQRGNLVLARGGAQLV